jgi:hypothetical protein
MPHILRNFFPALVDVKTVLLAAGHANSVTVGCAGAVVVLVGAGAELEAAFCCL